MTGHAQAGRRTVLLGALGIAGLACSAWDQAAAAEEEAEEDALVRRIAGGAASLSARVHLDMPAEFGNGYSVPMTLRVDSAMTEAEHVRMVRVLAPRNPVVTVAEFMFVPQSGRAEISTRIRLAKPQNVLAIAEMSDGTRLMARRFVTVKTDGCS